MAVFVSVGLLFIGLGFKNLYASDAFEVGYDIPQGASVLLAPVHSLPPVSPTPPPTRPAFNVSKTRFKALYWGGAPSTYQKASDFEKTYTCEATGRPLCVLRLTSKRGPVQDVHAMDAIVFRAWFTPTIMSRFPSPRRPEQKWVLMVDEAPQMLPKTFSNPIVGLFNISVGYRRDSHVPMLFGPSLVRTFDPPLKTSQRVQGAPVIWVAHNCIGFNNRHKYVEALMKYVNIHSYGDCLHTRDWPDPKYLRVASGGGRAHITKRDKDGVAPLASSDLEKLLKQYKFYLAFENQNCEDYVSEKFFRAIYTGLVPIVIGATNIHDFRPAERSIIRVSDFKSIKALGDYINYLDRNYTAYEEYLAYKHNPDLLLPEYRRLGDWQNIGTRHRGYSRGMDQLMCDVCYDLQLNVTTSPRRVQPFINTCANHNYETDAVADNREHPLPKDRPLPPALQALYHFRKHGTPPPGPDTSTAGAIMEDPLQEPMVVRETMAKAPSFVEGTVVGVAAPEEVDGGQGAEGVEGVTKSEHKQVQDPQQAQLQGVLDKLLSENAHLKEQLLRLEAQPKLRMPETWAGKRARLVVPASYAVAGVAPDEGGGAARAAAAAGPGATTAAVGASRQAGVARSLPVKTATAAATALGLPPPAESSTAQSTAVSPLATGAASGMGATAPDGLGAPASRAAPPAEPPVLQVPLVAESPSEPPPAILVTPSPQALASARVSAPAVVPLPPSSPIPVSPSGPASAGEAQRDNASYVAVYWGGQPSTFQMASDFETTYHCHRQSVPACSLLVTTKERHRLPTADALVCRAWYFPRKFERLPPKPPGQRWAMIIDEGPSMLPHTFSAPIFTQFDIRISYHLDSEVFMPFGPSLERLLEPPLPLEMKRKDAPVAWIAHNCEAFNNRQVFPHMHLCLCHNQCPPFLSVCACLCLSIHLYASPSPSLSLSLSLSVCVCVCCSRPRAPSADCESHRFCELWAVSVCVCVCVCVCVWLSGLTPCVCVGQLPVVLCIVCVCVCVFVSPGPYLILFVHWQLPTTHPLYSRA